MTVLLGCVKYTPALFYVGDAAESFTRTMQYIRSTVQSGRPGSAIASLAHTHSTTRWLTTRSDRIMAPVLRTLTVSYSDDTIYALAVTLSFLHLAFHDYSYANTTASGHFQARGGGGEAKGRVEKEGRRAEQFRRLGSVVAAVCSTEVVDFGCCLVWCFFVDAVCCLRLRGLLARFASFRPGVVFAARARLVIMPLVAFGGAIRTAASRLLLLFLLFFFFFCGSTGRQRSAIRNPLFSFSACGRLPRATRCGNVRHTCLFIPDTDV